MMAQALVLSVGTAAHFHETLGSFRDPAAVHGAPPPPPADFVALLENAAAELELTIAVLACHEAILDLGIRNVAEGIARSDEIRDAVDALTHMDVAAVFERFAHLLPPPDATTHAEEPAALSRAQLVRIAQARIDLWPHKNDEQLARRVKGESVAHRCRVALDWLESFVRRNRLLGEPPKIAGRAYAEGRLTLSEVATLLGCETMDAIALLEEHGFCRPAEQAVLSSERRAGMFAELDADRRARKGAPHLREDLIRRDVVATQRIEGIDARPWAIVR